ncbi:MAG: hypothetical protein RJS97_23595 [Parvibaculaceae bacterium]
MELKDRRPIDQLSNFVKNPREFDRHRTNGQFLIPDYSWDETTKNCGYRYSKDQIVELKDSFDTIQFFQLSDQFALGEEGRWQRYDSAFSAPNFLMWDGKQPTQQSPLALWDLSTGKRLRTLQGYHYGRIRGARLLKKNQLVTWGRDFLLRVWDTQSGQQQAMVPLPAVLNEAGMPIVTSRTCSYWTDAQFGDYLAGNSKQIAFDVTLMINAEQGSRTEFFNRTRVEPSYFSKYLFDSHREIHQIPAPFQELENSEAGYSDSALLADGRLLIGGITYGCPDHTYVWDGGLQLIILCTWLNDGANFEIDGEVSPGVVQVRNGETSVTFDLISVEA